ncbi:LysR family transcriptional regulator [Enterovibrio sp. ZSDZ35]|uniref:LysR family transcriptional regulator n=1 Tax=Enterovibrio qingdaonensis TaxID=2899818 RepID=A0ABT5QR82_9GAMM|nr:LysR family transcriptional regulator [Enterovibrio sp. ZSDZ35]MDD1783486.1 LysR family transcriptional regulator [Enterovibrio sp. ZSDZ35]
MKIEDLFLFVQVADQLSFTGAANVLDLPQSTVSRKIKQMEDVLEVRLFERTCREIFLTEPGKQFYLHSKKIVEEYENAKSFLTEYSEEPSGDITLHCMPYFTRLLSDDFFPKFMKSFPNIRITTRSFEPSKMEQLQDGDLIFYLFPPRDPNMVARRIFTISRRFYASPEYLLQHGEPKHPSELEKHNCLRFDSRILPADVWQYSDGNELCSVKVSGSFTCDSIKATFDLSVRGVGVCWVPQTMADKMVREKKLVCLFGGKYGMEQPYYVIYHSRNYLPKKTKVFLEMLTKHMEGNKQIFV